MHWDVVFRNFDYFLIGAYPTGPLGGLAMIGHDAGPRADLRVLDAAAVDWPDGSAGCPEPGVLYTQAVVPGYRIRIQAGDAVLNYHATRHSQAPVLCPAKRAQPALPPRGGIT